MQMSNRRPDICGFRICLGSRRDPERDAAAWTVLDPDPAIVSLDQT
jgi:hypothetical protein